MNTLPSYIAVEGAIGVGKTTLCHKLSERFNQELILEEPQNNPFLEDFYKMPERVALQTQLSFLLQRVKQLQNLYQGDLFRTGFNRGYVADYIIQKDRLFAQMILSDEEYRLYEMIFNHMVVNIPRPDLIVYLQAPLNILQERIQKRNRHYEKTIEANYLEQLNQTYMRFFHDYSDTPIIVVNTEAINIVTNDGDLQQLIDFIKAHTKGRHYFNPTPLNKF